MLCSGLKKEYAGFSEAMNRSSCVLQFTCPAMIRNHAPLANDAYNIDKHISDALSIDAAKLSEALEMAIVPFSACLESRKIA